MDKRHSLREPPAHSHQAVPAVHRVHRPRRDDVNRPELAPAGMDVGTPNGDPESPSLQGWGRLLIPT